MFSCSECQKRNSHAVLINCTLISFLEDTYRESWLVVLTEYKNKSDFLLSTVNGLPFRVARFLLF